MFKLTPSPTTGKHHHFGAFRLVYKVFMSTPTEGEECFRRASKRVKEVLLFPLQDHQRVRIDSTSLFTVTKIQGGYSSVSITLLTVLGRFNGVISRRVSQKALVLASRNARTNFGITAGTAPPSPTPPTCLERTSRSVSRHFWLMHGL